MKKWKHITFEQRKTISSGIAHNMKVKNIALLNLLNKIIIVVLNFKDGLMFVLTVKTNTKNVHLINSFIMLKMHKILLIII